MQFSRQALAVVSLCFLSVFLKLTTTLEAAPYQPTVAPASDEAQAAIKQFRPAPGLKVDLFAAEPYLANPVAFCIDEHGRFYVAETFRHSPVGPAFRLY